VVVGCMNLFVVFDGCRRILNVVGLNDVGGVIYRTNMLQALHATQY
jgi:hypothetical protein